MTNRLTPHVRYLKYVLLHKLYVWRAGVAIGGYSLPWLWRLLVHDLSKFSRAEWGPYVTQFYGDKATAMKPDNVRSFNRAWLHHLHANPHHWQHWILHEDSGAQIVLVPEACGVVNEMVADWLAAGTKILSRPSMHECVAETIVWYGRVHTKQLMRREVREHVEMLLLALAEKYGVRDVAWQIKAAQDGRASVTIAR